MADADPRPPKRRKTITSPVSRQPRSRLPSRQPLVDSSSGNARFSFPFPCSTIPESPFARENLEHSAASHGVCSNAATNGLCRKGTAAAGGDTSNLIAPDPILYRSQPDIWSQTQSPSSRAEHGTPGLGTQQRNAEDSATRSGAHPSSSLLSKARRSRKSAFGGRDEVSRPSAGDGRNADLTHLPRNRPSRGSNDQSPLRQSRSPVKLTLKMPSLPHRGLHKRDESLPQTKRTETLRVGSIPSPARTEKRGLDVNARPPFLNNAPLPGPRASAEHQLSIRSKGVSAIPNTVAPAKNASSGRAMDSRKGGFRNDSRLQDPVIVIDDSDDATKARSIDGNNRSAVEPRRRRPLPWTGREPDRHGQARRHAPVHVEKKFKWPDYLRSAEDGDPHLTGATAGRGDIRSSVPASTAAPASKNQARPHFKIPSGEGLFKDFSERTLERERVLKVQLTELEQEAERQRKVQRDLEVARRSLELQQERLQELSRRWSERARQLGLDAQDGSTLDKPECGNVAVRHGVDDAAARLAGTNSVNRVCEGSRPNTLLKSRQPNQTGKVAPRSAALRTAARLVSLKQALSRQQRSEGQSPKGPRCHVEELNFVSLDFSTVRAALSGSAPPAGNASSKPRPSQKAPFDQAMSCSDLVAPPNPAVASAQAPTADVEQPSGVPNTAPGQGSGGSEAVDEERREPAARADPGHEPTSSNHVPPPETTTRRDIISKAQTPFERLLGLPQDSAAVKKMIRQYIHFAAGRTQRVVLRKDRGRGGGGRGGGVGDDGGSGR